MFEMKIDKQLNLQDRTLLLGEPNFNELPKIVYCGNVEYNVIGVSSGVPSPYISLEIEKEEANLVGKTLIG